MISKIVQQPQRNDITEAIKRKAILNSMTLNNVYHFVFIEICIICRTEVELAQRTKKERNIIRKSKFSPCNNIISVTKCDKLNIFDIYDITDLQFTVEYILNKFDICKSDLTC